MRLLVSGICGFAGSVLTRALRELHPEWSIGGIDNFIRPGSPTNIEPLKKLGVTLHHGDVRLASDFETLPAVDWVIDCAANPSVLAGVDGRTSGRQLLEHNLAGSINLLEYCKRCNAGFILLSTSRVYSIPPLAALPVVLENDAFVPDKTRALPAGLSIAGVGEDFSTASPVSLYGASKLASETIALEYGHAFDFPVFVNRCGVLAGAGQFGRPDQGIFAFWIHSWAQKRNLQYLGFDGAGHQVRDCLHPEDLAPLLDAQMASPHATTERIINVSGGIKSALSLRQLSHWCRERFGDHPVESQREGRDFDIPWMVLNATRAREIWNWRPSRAIDSILDEIAKQAREMPTWLDLSAPL